MAPNPSVPDIPSDWTMQDAQGTPYVLGIANGDTAWRPVIVVEAVTTETGALVTSESDRPVFID